MLSADFLKKLRRIELHTRKIINSTFVGEYKSTFKGQGMEFIDVREYLPGDDVRSIDWKVTARMDKPFVKKFVEERELTVILCVDASGSGYFGTRSQFKLEQAAQVAATIAFSAVTNNDKVGLLFFTDDVERFIPPRKGKQHVLRLIRDILLFQPRRRGTNPTAALEYLEDMETGERITIDTGRPALRKSYEQHMRDQETRRDRLFTQLGIDCIPLRTDEDFTPKLHKFFQLRARRFH